MQYYGFCSKRNASEVLSPFTAFFITTFAALFFENINGGKFLLGNNLACKVAGIGTISIRMFDGNERDLKQVKYVPELKRNIIFLGVMDQVGCNTKAENGNLQIQDKDLIIMKGIKKNGLYVLVGSTTMPAITTIVSNDKTKLWHMRLAHMNERGLKELSKQGLLGTDQVTSLQFCEKCVFGKATRHKFNFGRQETKHTLDYVHSDIWGPS